MADYIYTMEIRLTPDQQRGVTLVQDIARAAGMNIYLTGGASATSSADSPSATSTSRSRAIPSSCKKTWRKLASGLPASMTTLRRCTWACRETFAPKSAWRASSTTRKPASRRHSPATLIEDLRRRDFTVNAMALSLNPGSRGLLMDPFNGAADIEAKLLRVLHNYAFVEDPSRLIRATRFAARFHWPLEERTQARFESAKENNYIEYITNKAMGYEIEQLAYEDDPLHIVKVLEKEGWLKVLNPHWTRAKVDTASWANL